MPAISGSNGAANTITSTAGRIQYQSIFGTDVTPGSYRPNLINTIASGMAEGAEAAIQSGITGVVQPTTIVNYDISAGGPQLNAYVGSKVDVSPPIFSGYAITGVPTYGSGKAQITTNWKADFSHLPGSGNFQFYTPTGSGGEYFYSKLSS